MRRSSAARTASLPLLAFQNVGERLGQQLVEPLTHDPLDLGLPQRLGLEGLVGIAVAVAFVALQDRLNARRRSPPPDRG